MEQRFGNNSIDLVTLREFCEREGESVSYRRGDQLERERLRVGDGTSGMGNALLDLYIHPLDLVCFLFGQPEILACRQVAKDSYILMLQHPHIVGILEISTAYSWITAEESLKVCTHSGIYRPG